jgi:hypothetical protein
MDRVLHGFLAVIIRWVTRLSVWSFAFFAASMAANAQFKVVGPPPYTPAVARQQIKTFLEKVDPGNRQQTIQTLTGLLAWYRDIIDEELIAAWHKDTRANLTEVAESLADSRVAVAIVEFSWREHRQAAFNLDYAPMFENLMARFPESAKPFLDDFFGSIATGQPTPDLSQPESEAICRILLDMPDIGAWRNNALLILPHYRRVAEGLLAQDLHSTDREKSYRAQIWLADLKIDTPSIASKQQDQRATSTRSLSSPAADSATTGTQTRPIASLSRAARNPAPISAATNPAPAVQPLPAAVPSAALPYNGAKSGTLECTGSPIPQNAEYVFRNLPPVKIKLDYDTKTWDATLEPAEGPPQRLILTNKSSGPQRRCAVHWSVIP